MTSIDISDPEILKNVKLVQDGSSEHRWVAFGYVPKSNNKFKLYDYGSGDLKELREELGDSTIRFAYMRYSINNMPKFVYIAWCGDGVNGPIKGSFSGHAIQFGTHLKPVHHQLNARNEDDLDEKAIIAALTKATGANYDSGAKVQGTTKAFVPTSVAQGRESATKSNAEVKNFVNKNDYNKVNESAEYWKQNQQVSTPAPAPVTKSAPSRTVANKFTEQALKPAPAPAPVNKPAPSRTVANKFTEQALKPIETPSKPAPVPSRPVKPAAVFRQPEPQQTYEEPQQTYEEPQQTYEEPQQTYEEPQQTYEEPQYDQQQSYDDQQQSYDDQQQSYDNQQQYDQGYDQQQQYDQSYDQQQQQQYDQGYDQQQQYDEQQYEQPQEDQQQSYDDQQQYDQQQSYDDGYQRVTALYDYVGENEGDLSFRAGDVIIVLDSSDPDGWYQGQLEDGSQGYYPSNFCQ